MHTVWQQTFQVPESTPNASSITEGALTVVGEAPPIGVQTPAVNANDLLTFSAGGSIWAGVWLTGQPALIRIEEFNRARLSRP
jgi:hypothetical protein